jgi:hypothetical protein
VRPAITPRAYLVMRGARLLKLLQFLEAKRSASINGFIEMVLYLVSSKRTCPPLKIVAYFRRHIGFAFASINVWVLSRKIIYVLVYSPVCISWSKV